MFSLKVGYKVIKSTALALFILMQLFLIFVKKHDTLDLDITPNTQPSPNIGGQGKVGQTFIARRNGLARIDVLLGTHKRENDKDIYFTLWERRPENKELVTITFNADSVRDNLFHPFRFTSQTKSEGREYYFYFQSPESTFENSICVWTNTKNIYPDGQYLLNDRAAQGDIIFRVYSKRPVFSELRRVVKNYPGIFGQTWLLILAILFFEGIQILILSKLVDYFRQTWREP